MKTKPIQTFLFTLFLAIALHPNAQAQDLEQLQADGFQAFEVEIADSTYLMKQYFVCFLKRGNPEAREGLSEAEIADLQKQHLDYGASMGEQNKLCLAGPFGDDGDLRGIWIFNVPTREEAEELASNDPFVKRGMLSYEIHPWWGAVGTKLY